MSGKATGKRNPKPSLKFKEGIDYYIDEEGRFVFTAHYLSKRGYCCKNGCRHCPYGFSKDRS